MEYMSIRNESCAGRFDLPQKTKEAQAAVLLGMIAQLQTARGARMLTPLGLNRSKFAVLQYIADNATATIGEMSERLDINQPGITKIVKQFVDEGLVKTAETDSDRRVKPLSLTRKGLYKYQQTFAALQPAIAQPYKNWSAEELEVFTRSLEKLKTWLVENRTA